MGFKHTAWLLIFKINFVDIMELFYQQFSSGPLIRFLMNSK